MASPSKKQLDPLDKPETSEGTKILFTCLMMTGLISPPRYKKAYKIFSVVLIFFNIIVVPLSFAVSYTIAAHRMTLNHMLTSMQIALNVYACGMKFVFIIYKRDHLYKLLKLLDKLDTAIRYPEQIQAAKDGINLGNRIVRIYLVYYYMYSVFSCLGSFYFGRPPFSLYIPFLNWRDSYRSFVAATIIEFLSCNTVIMQGMCMDVYGLVFSSLWHAHFKILIKRVQRIATDPTFTQQHNHKELLQCVRHHRLLIIFCENITPLLSITYFIQFMVTAIALSLCLINITISNDSTTFIGSAVFSVGLVMETLPMCYMITSIKDEGSRLSEVIFHINWMDQTKEFCQTCTFFMHRAQQDMSIYAGKLINITLDTFVAIMKFSFSLYTLLNNMEFGQEYH